MAVSRAYIDTWYLVEIVKEGELKEDVDRLLYKISQPSFEILIPQIVLGETISQILEEYDKSDVPTKLEKLSNIIYKYKIDVSACLPPPPNNAIDIMNKLQIKDAFLDITDNMILSHALADPESKFFFTKDSKMLGNNAIIQLEEELRVVGSRHERLKVTDWL